MATRRLAQRQDPELAKLSENVRVSQQEVAWAAALLDMVGELARSADDPLVAFSLGESLRAGVSRQSARAKRDGVRLDVPPGGTEFRLFGPRERFEQAIADLTTHAISRAGRGGVVTWTLLVRDGRAEVAVSWPGTPDDRAERMFVLVRRKPGDPPDASLFLARWAVESLGGTIAIEAEGDRLRAAAVFPEEEAG